MKKFIAICLLLIGIFLLQSFTVENPYFRITDKDVQLVIPKIFPAPIYNFSNNKLSPEVFVLGRKLFYDPVLSRDSSTSCASCHQRIAAFAHIDHPLSHGINGLIGTRNVPPIQNMIWQTNFMWDGGINHIELQPIAPLTNAREMDNSLLAAIKKLSNNAVYKTAFQKAFGDTMINSQRILKSLAQFTGLMISANSRYDLYLQGQDSFSSEEQKGLAIFTSKCASCHKPPLFTDNTFRNNGLAFDTSLKDSGRAIITHRSADFMKFKVPSLRNISMTYPYMHDGRLRTLDAVLNHYNHPLGNKQQTDAAIGKGLALTDADKANLIAFLKTLYDKTFLYDRRFADPNY